ncbi:MAG: sugar-binding domain-containing protein [Bacteroidales bacterium]
MKKALNLLTCCLSAILTICCTESKTEEIDLSGVWEFQSDPNDIGVKEQWYINTLQDKISLPGSMAENDKGEPVGIDTRWVGGFKDQKWFEKPNYKPYLSDSCFLFPFWLTPDKHYYGAAWYKKEISIPKTWEGKTLELFLERCHSESSLWVDDTKIGTQNSLGTAHIYKLNALTPGTHTITLCIDNRIKDINVGENSHSVSDHTQSNWNGIVGKMTLSPQANTRIENIQIFPDVNKKVARVQIEINSTEKTGKAKLSLQAKSLTSSSANKVQTLSKEIELKGSQTLNIEYPMGENVLLWDEFDPNLYLFTANLEHQGISDEESVQFGMRDFKVAGTNLSVNGRPIFLRGTLECAIFPKTGYPPTDAKEWKRIMQIIKAHGLNHIRFHSWCPPEVAFNVADQLGIYLQAEVSSWANDGASIGDGKPLDKWIYDESERMIRQYGNHPSFCMMAYGNEPAGANQKEYLTSFIQHWRNKDLRRVYTSGAGWPAIPANDFHNVPQPRIQGWAEGLKSIINSEPPRSDYDWRNKLGANDRPVVSHEIGQWCVYPNLKEIEKYDGVLKARNFELFKKSLDAHKMLPLADSFLLASGKLQALCYKADIEAALRTPGFAGFQLLDLHDFPGQGTALVGVLDAFWEEKGYISPEEYSQFCNETVPLARFGKRVFMSNEPINVTLEAAHFGKKELDKTKVSWQISNTSGNTIEKGEISLPRLNWGTAQPIGNIKTSISTEKAQQFKLTVNIADYSNTWDFWVYPTSKVINTDVKIVQKLDSQTLDFIKNGGKALLSINKGDIKQGKGGEVGIGFSSIFWNTAWTNGQKPHTLGILCNPKHPALADFPSEYHSNWQWWDAMSHSNAISLEDFPAELSPIVRVIDDWVTNNRLALLFETKLGKGKLLISGIDLRNDLDKRPEARQLLNSLLKYMDSNAFKPNMELSQESIVNLFN